MLPTIKHQDIGATVLVAKLLTGYIKIKSKIDDPDSYIKANGVFDADFTAYMVTWQGNHGLTADGIIGPNTWTEIAKQAPTCSTSKNKTSGYTMALQILLDSNITCDGVYGARTKAAVDRGGLNELNSKLTKHSFLLTPPSGWTMAFNNCYVYGNLVYISGMFSNTTAQSAKKFDMGNCIPNEYTSPYRFGFVGFNNSTDNPLHGIVDGQTIIFYRPQTENLTAIEFSATYII